MRKYILFSIMFFLGIFGNSYDSSAYHFHWDGGTKCYNHGNICHIDVDITFGLQMLPEYVTPSQPAPAGYEYVTIDAGGFWGTSSTIALGGQTIVSAAGASSVEIPSQTAYYSPSTGLW